LAIRELEFDFDDSCCHWMENFNSTLTVAIGKDQKCEITMKMTIRASQSTGKLQIAEQKAENAKIQLK
jgi:hypothetical protein